MMEQKKRTLRKIVNLEAYTTSINCILHACSRYEYNVYSSIIKHQTRITNTRIGKVYTVGARRSKSQAARIHP